MKTRVLIVVMSMLSLSSYAYIGGIAIQSDKHASMQVTVNGKVYNKQPGSFVRIKSQPGLFHLQLKIWSAQNKAWYVLHRDVRVHKGLEYFYKVEFAANGKPVFRLEREYPVYSKYFWNPALYTKSPIT